MCFRFFFDGMFTSTWQFVQEGICPIGSMWKTSLTNNATSLVKVMNQLILFSTETKCVIYFQLWLKAPSLSQKIYVLLAGGQ